MEELYTTAYKHEFVSNLPGAKAISKWSPLLHNKPSKSHINTKINKKSIVFNLTFVNLSILEWH